MQSDTGKISLIQTEPNGDRSIQIAYNPKLSPQPGQYLQAHHPDEPDAALGWNLFPVGLPITTPGEENAASFRLAPIPRTWQPGTRLQLYGPLGKGFKMPSVNRLALVALGESASRLLPLIQPARDENTDIVLFSNAPLPPLPPVIEIQPLSALPETLAWADFMALDLPAEKLTSLRKIFGLEYHNYLTCPAQALISIPMPCAGIGECGVCAVPRRRKGYALACKDGPVFDLNTLDW